MKFIIDAQLPPSLVGVIRLLGYDAIHTLSLPEKNLSSDQFINLISLKEKRILITKDSDFYHSYILKNEPYKLLLIRVGNMSKNDLKELIRINFDKIVISFKEGSLIELTKEKITILH